MARARARSETVPRWLVWLTAAVLGAGGTGWTIHTGETVSDRVTKLEVQTVHVLETVKRLERKIDRWEPSSD